MLIATGDGLHWSYFVLQDPLGLISLFNSSSEFEKQLELFFTEHVDYTEKFGEAVPNPYFWQVLVRSIFAAMTFDISLLIISGK